MSTRAGRIYDGKSLCSRCNCYVAREHEDPCPFRRTMTDPEIDRLNEDSKNDRHIIVGSDIRGLIAMLRKAREERDFLSNQRERAERFKEALHKAHNAMLTWFSAEYANHPVSIEVSKVLDEKADDQTKA